MIDELLLATNNSHKVKEIREILSGKVDRIITLTEAGIDINVIEDGDTFFLNALKKAKEVSEASGMITLADDTGLLVDALNGEPGVHSARYAEAHNDAANNEKLLKNLEDYENRSAKFVTVIVLYYPNGEYILAEGKVDGEILSVARGSNGFGYDSLFFCPELKKTFGECSGEEKNSVSHRARALRNLLEKL